MLLTILRRWSRSCFLFCVALWFILRGASCFKVLSCSLSLCFLVFFTSTGEEGDGLCASRAFLFVCFTHVSFCPFSPPLDAAVCDCETPWTFMWFFLPNTYNFLFYRYHDLFETAEAVLVPLLLYILRFCYYDNNYLHLFIMPQTSKKLTGHIGFGLSVSPCVRPRVRSSSFLMHAMSNEPCMLGFWNFIYRFLMKK